MSSIQQDRTVHVAAREPASAGGAASRGEAAPPIRVVVFGGAFFEPHALQFLARLDAHPDIDLVGGVCQSRGFGVRDRIGDIVRRRGAMAAPVLAVYLASGIARTLRAPRTTLRVRRGARAALSRIRTVPQIHDTSVLEHVRALAPDLGLVYGSPILKPALFEIPRLGTLGIHQGSLPKYRGKKTTFWAMYNGETSAGVAIQKIGTGLDTGAIVRSGEVEIGRKRFGRVDVEVQQLGVDLYIDAILAIRRGDAEFIPQPPGAGELYRQPRPQDILALWRRQVAAWRGGA